MIRLNMLVFFINLILIIHFLLLGCFVWFWIAILCKRTGVWQGSILEPTLFLLYINDPPVDIFCNFIFADNATCYLKLDKASDLFQQFELASKLEPDLQDTLNWGRKWLLNFSFRKTWLVIFDHLDFDIWCSFDSGSYIFSITKLYLRKLKPWFILEISFLLRLSFISTNLPTDILCNTVVISGLVFLFAIHISVG